MKSMNGLTFLMMLVCIGNWHTVSAQLVCNSSISLNLGSECQVTITPDVIGISLDPAYDYSLSDNTFDCYDVGHSLPVVLEQRDRITHQVINNCYSTISVESKNIPNPCDNRAVYCRSDLTVRLNDEGSITLTPEMVSAVPIPDNPYFVYSVEPANLDCSNLGLNLVRLQVTSACFPFNYCWSNVTVQNSIGSLATCYVINTNGMDFTPFHLDVDPVPPAAIINYRAPITFINEQQLPPNGEFRMLLSKDKVPDAKDVLLDKQIIVFNRKSNSISGKFIIPRNTSFGNYYLIGDMYSKNKKYNFGFPTVVQKIVINKVIRERSESSDVTDIRMFPNPFQSTISLSGNVESVSNIQLLGILGNFIENVSLDKNEIDLSKLVNGIYYLKFQRFDGSESIQKIIKTSN